MSCEDLLVGLVSVTTTSGNASYSEIKHEQTGKRKIKRFTHMTVDIFPVCFELRRRLMTNTCSKKNHRGTGKRRVAVSSWNVSQMLYRFY